MSNMNDAEMIAVLNEAIIQARLEISRLTLMLDDPYFCVTCSKPYPKKAINQLNHRCFSCDNPGSSVRA